MIWKGHNQPLAIALRRNDENRRLTLASIRLKEIKHWSVCKFSKSWMLQVATQKFSWKKFAIFYLLYMVSPTPVLLPGKSHGRRSLVGCNPWGCWGSDTTEWFHFHFSLWCIGEGNGNPLQGFCLENCRDGGAWWAAVYGVTQSWTRLKRLSSSSREGVVDMHSLFNINQTVRNSLAVQWLRLHTFTALGLSSIPDSGT